MAMTMSEKLDKLKKYRPYVYSKIKKRAPGIIRNPFNLTAGEKNIYNTIINEEAKRDGGNESFKNNFSA